MKMKKLLVCLLAVGALGASSTVLAQDKGGVGISMPTKASARWIDDGDNMVKVFKAQGYKPDLQYADDDIPNQLAQIENMVTKGVKVLVIAAIDGTTLSDVLQKAHDKGIKIISYDRLIRNSKNVDYYATFDNFQVGVLQGQYIENALGLKSGKGPFNIELFGGSADDNNAFFFYNGAMSVLKPYMDKGKLVVRSKQLGMDKVATLRWDGAVAQSRMDNLLSANYGNARVDAVLSPYDGGTLPIETEDEQHVFNSSLVYGPDGACVARYDKIHLFFFDNGSERYDERRVIQPGTEPVCFDLPSRDGHRWRIGLSVCYDLRFPELYRSLAARGAELLLVPSAFTRTTGAAHWELLLRARAVENLAWVVAPAQGGTHENKRQTWGQSMVVDPWGTVVAQQATGEGVVLAEIDARRTETSRAQLPVLSHRVL